MALSQKSYYFSIAKGGKSLPIEYLWWGGGGGREVSRIPPDEGGALESLLEEGGGTLVSLPGVVCRDTLDSRRNWSRKDIWEEGRSPNTEKWLFHQYK